MSEAAGQDSAHLSEREQEQAATSTPIGPLVIHEVVREQGLNELNRAFSGLAWSGLAAGLSISFSFIMQATLRAGLPDAPWRHLVDSFGYSLGFLIVVLGQQQLFTETTLTAAIPALTGRTTELARRTARVWAIVLVANLTGTIIIGAILATTGLVPDDVAHAMDDVASATMQASFWHGVMAACFAGWLIALMVWLLPGAGPARPLIIILLTYAISANHFPHVIAGSVEASYLVVKGAVSVPDYLLEFLAPVLVGNVLGGTLLTALLNHAPVAAELEEGKPPYLGR